MIKLTYKEVKDNGVIETIAKMKDEVLPGKVSWALMKIHRRLKKEADLVDDQLRNEHQKHIVKNEKGEPVPVPEVRSEDGLRVLSPARLWQYTEGGQEAHEKAVKELIDLELMVPDQQPIDIQFFIERDIPLAHLVGLEPISAEYQAERLKDPEVSGGVKPALAAVKN